MTRLLDPDGTLKAKICEFVARGDFGLAGGARSDGTYNSTWFSESIDPAEVAFDSDVFLLTKDKAKSLKAKPTAPVTSPTKPTTSPTGGSGGTTSQSGTPAGTTTTVESAMKTITLSGSIPPELWNRLGTKVLPKLRAAEDLEVGVHFTASLDARAVDALMLELRQVLEELGAAGVHVATSD